jgi:cation diffusion facilitator CzcD-associated flavoprotein CzcO
MQSGAWAIRSELVPKCSDDGVGAVSCAIHLLFSYHCCIYMFCVPQVRFSSALSSVYSPFYARHSVFRCLTTYRNIMASESLSLRARTVAVVGAGPSGVAAARYLLAEKAFDKIVLFEQRSRSGGIWNYTADETNEDLFTIPQTDPRGKNQDPIWTQQHPQCGLRREHCSEAREKDVSFVSPMYGKLETNIPRGLMGFQDLDWPTDSQLFPTHQTVLKYIEDYGKDVQHLVQYCTQVVNAEPTSQKPDSSWRVRVRQLETSKQEDLEFDALVVANGHFIVPYIPDIPGIKEWNEKYPGRLNHSKYYRRPEDFADKKVIVVGNSASGADISAQVASQCSPPLLWSSKSVSLFSATHSSRNAPRREVPPIKRFIPDDRSVEFEDGAIETNIDNVLFATGYFYSLPFLENVKPALITDGSHLNHTYQHIFYAPQPTLSFLALNQRVIPFPIAEAQSSVIARVYSGRLSLPPYAEMQKWEESVIAEVGDGRNFHLLPFPRDGDYLNAMSHWALSAPSKEGLDDDGKGKVPPIWGEWEYWCRENFPAIRRAFGEFGEKRHQIKSIEEVGFSFEDFKKEKERIEGEMI